MWLVRHRGFSGLQEGREGGGADAPYNVMQTGGTTGHTRGHEQIEFTAYLNILVGGGTQFTWLKHLPNVWTEWYFFFL